jgi:hypothetical protein
MHLRTAHRFKASSYHLLLQTLVAKHFIIAENHITKESCNHSEKVVIIRSGTFDGCSSLREVGLSEDTKAIQSRAFRGCVALEGLSLPPKVTGIDSHAFKDCSKLSQLNIGGETLGFIGKDAFQGCTSMERFTLPDLTSRLETIIRDGRYRTQVENKRDNIYEGEWRNNVLSLPATHQPKNLPPPLEHVFHTTEVDFDRSKRKSIIKLISYYEMKETTILLELALWKYKIDEADVPNTAVARETCHIEVPGPVKDTILQYAYPELVDRFYLL